MEEIFDALPVEVGFDVEIKAIDNPLQPHTSKSEIERLVEPTMAIVEKEQKKVNNARKIVISSLDPDVCAYVKEKWPQYQVGFISDCGAEGKHADERRNSVEKMMEVGKDYKLDIIITDSRNVLDSNNLVEKAN